MLNSYYVSNYVTLSKSSYNFYYPLNVRQTFAMMCCGCNFKTLCIQNLPWRVRSYTKALVALAPFTKRTTLLDLTRIGSWLSPHTLVVWPLTRSMTISACAKQQLFSLIWKEFFFQYYIEWGQNILVNGSQQTIRLLKVMLIPFPWLEVTLYVHWRSEEKVVGDVRMASPSISALQAHTFSQIIGIGTISFETFLVKERHSNA